MTTIREQRIALGEEAANKIIAVCEDLGLTRKEVASTAFAVAINHLHATKVASWKTQRAVGEMYAYRDQYPVSEKCLVTDRTVDPEEGVGAEPL